MADTFDDSTSWPKFGDKLVGLTGDPYLAAWISGRTDLDGHIDGYKLAADLIYERIGGQPRLLGTGNLVFPMVFLYRHFVELSIKDVIALGEYLENGRSAFPTHHRLSELWRDARALILRIGPGCTNDDLDAMENLIGELQAIDPISFSFRYPTTKDGAPTLPAPTEFNLQQFRAGIEKMAGFFIGARSMLSDYREAKNSSY